MTDQNLERPPGHVFISYVREDEERVARLRRLLEAAGVRVWIDKSDIGPGDDWKLEISRAISDNALAFIACFSKQSEARVSNYQNEELILAAEQMRLRRPGRSWFIPVRFDDCEIPEYDIGPGRTFRSINRIDLNGDEWPSFGRLLVAIGMILSAGGSGSIPIPEAKTGMRPDVLRKLLLDPSAADDLEEQVDRAIGPARDKLRSLGRVQGVGFGRDSALKGYEVRIAEIADILADCTLLFTLIGAYGAASCAGIIRRAARRMMGNVVEPWDLPYFLMHTALVAGSSHRDNWYPVGVIAEWLQFDKRPQLIPAILDRDDPRDFLPDILWPVFQRAFGAGERDFADAYSKAQAMLVSLSHCGTDRGALLDIVVRDRHQWLEMWTALGPSLEMAIGQLGNDADQQGSSWPPLAAGLFDSSSTFAYGTLRECARELSELRQFEVVSEPKPAGPPPRVAPPGRVGGWS